MTYMLYVAFVIFLTAFGAFLARNIPAIAIPVGLLLLAPFLWGMAENYFLSRDNSVGAMFAPLILFVLSVIALIGVFLFIANLGCISPRRLQMNHALNNK